MRMEMTRQPCPVCGGYMLMLYGCGWDYDRWLCGERGCEGEIELETTTFPDEMEDGGP